MTRTAAALLFLPALAFAAPVPKAMKTAKPPDLNGSWRVVDSKSVRIDTSWNEWWVIDGESVKVSWSSGDGGRMVGTGFPRTLVRPAGGGLYDLDMVDRMESSFVSRTRKGRVERDGDTLRLYYAAGKDDPRPDRIDPNGTGIYYEFRLEPPVRSK